MTSQEFSLVIIKPDALQKNLLLELECRIHKAGLRIVRQEQVLLTLALLKELYLWDVIIDPVALESYLCCMPLPIWILEGANAIQEVMNIKIDLRIKFGVDKLHTLLHCPDSAEDFHREYCLFFPEDSLQ